LLAALYAATAMKWVLYGPCNWN